MKKLLSTSFMLIWGFLSLSAQCPDSLWITTQSQIDSFQIIYPGCTEIEGDVWIFGGDNLNGLSPLTVVYGDMFISGGNLIDLSGLDNITMIGGWLILQGMDSLVSLNGLGNLITIGGNFSLGASESGGPDALVNLSGLNSLETIGSFSASGCETLNSLTGLEGITTLNGLSLGYNSSLENVYGLSNVTNINGNVSIHGNDVLQNFVGLDNLEVITGDLNIGKFGQMANPTIGNLSLKSLSGLNNLTSIGGNLEIMGNDSLVDFTGLNNLNSIGGSLDIFYNLALTNIEQLSNLNSINGRIKIGYDYWNMAYGNVSLVSLTGLDNIHSGTITEIDIAWNYSLSDCEAISVCNAIEILDTTLVYVHDNAPGCNNPEEVQDSCEAHAGIYDDIYFKSNLVLYPNPAYQIVTISTDACVEIDEVSIYTLTGQEILQTRPVSEKVDISHLRPGMYIIEVRVDNARLRQKLLVE